MKKKINFIRYFLYIITFAFAHNSYSQQCQIPFDTLLVSMNYGTSDFKTFASKNGFSYDAQARYFICNTKDTKGASNSLIYQTSPYLVSLVYTFNDKTEYSTFKTILEKGELKETKDDNTGQTLTYNLNGFSYLLRASTTHETNRYFITIIWPK